LTESNDCGPGSSLAIKLAAILRGCCCSPVSSCTGPFRDAGGWPCIARRANKPTPHTRYRHFFVARSAELSDVRGPDALISDSVGSRTPCARYAEAAASAPELMRIAIPIGGWLNAKARA